MSALLPSLISAVELLFTVINLSKPYFTDWTARLTPLRKMDNFEIRLLTPEDRPQLRTFLQKHIRLDGAPLMVDLKLPETESNYIAHNMVLDAFVKPDQICSFLAIEKSNNEIIGCSLNAICDPTDPHPVDDPSIPREHIEKTDQFKMLCDFSRLMWSGVDEFLPTSYTGPYLRVDLGLVDPNYRKLGLYRRLMKIALKFGNSLGCNYAIGHFTSHKSQAYSSAEGWTTLRWVNFEDYYVLGKRIFQFENDPEQKCSKLMMLNLEDWLKNNN